MSAVFGSVRFGNPARSVSTLPCARARSVSYPSELPQTGKLSIAAKDEADADKKFSALAQGGEVRMPLGKTFFSRRFGMVADKFGVNWMVLVPQH
jgi:uncharacterized glyoxalase superfamily protein PhnB